jgi:hypothetical protein
LAHRMFADRKSRIGIVFAGLMLATALGITTLQTSNTAQASGGLWYQWGLYLANGWLCYGWSNGTYHCTQRWHRDSAGHLISDNPSWVPNSGSSTSSSSPKPASSGSTTLANTAGEPCRSTNYWRSPISQWTVPPSCYSGIYRVNPSNYVRRSGFGYCNWWPEVRHPNTPDILWGRHHRSSRPTPGAAVYFAPHVQGASGDGHYAEVVAVRPGGSWVLISEMNFYWRGGGFGKVSYRYIHTGPGVTFITA